METDDRISVFLSRDLSGAALCGQMFSLRTELNREGIKKEGNYSSNSNILAQLTMEDQSNIMLTQKS